MKIHYVVPLWCTLESSLLWVKFSTVGKKDFHDVKEETWKYLPIVGNLPSAIAGNS